MSRWVLLVSIASVCVLSGCATRGLSGVLRSAGGSAALVEQFAAFDGKSRHPVDWARLVARARDADVVFFGEEHYDVVCNQLEAQLLADLASGLRPVSLAMEFIERDAQPALNDFLAGRMDEAKFRADTRQGRLYPVSHRALLNLCRAAGIPVIAANAPRRLVREYRTSGKDYPAFRAGLSAADQLLVPTVSEWLAGAYYVNFQKVMSGHGEDGSATSQPSVEDKARLDRAYRSQLMWDDSMAEAVAQHRSENSSRRAMLIVGSFHVANDGGTLTKYRARRPNDRVFTIVYRGSDSPPLAFDAGDAAAADVIIYGIKPKPESKAASAPSGS